jgi:hypothetical protein
MLQKFGTSIASLGLEKNKTEVDAMLMLWIVIGCLFLTGIGVRFTYKVLGLTPVEAAAIYILIVMLVGVNTAPARQLLSALF